MSTFTLTICCLTAIHLIHGPNIPGSYAVLFFTADLLSPATTTTGHHFHFGSAFSLFLEPFLHTSLQKHIRHLLTSWAHLSLSYVFSFHTVHGVLKARMLKYFAIPFSVDHILSELSTMTCPSWVALNGMAHRFIDSCKPLCHNKPVTHEGEKVI